MNNKLENYLHIKQAMLEALFQKQQAQDFSLRYSVETRGLLQIQYNQRREKIHNIEQVK